MIGLVVSRELMKCPRIKLWSIICNDFLRYSMPSENTFTVSDYLFSCHSLQFCCLCKSWIVINDYKSYSSGFKTRSSRGCVCYYQAFTWYIRNCKIKLLYGSATNVNRKHTFCTTDLFGASSHLINPGPVVYRNGTGSKIKKLTPSSHNVLLSWSLTLDASY